MALKSKILIVGPPEVFVTVLRNYMTNLVFHKLREVKHPFLISYQSQQKLIRAITTQRKVFVY